MSAFSSPFGQQHYSDGSSDQGQDQEQEQGQGQDLLQPLLRSPSQLSSAAPSTSDARLNAIPEHEQMNEDADAGLSAKQESKEQVTFSPLICINCVGQTIAITCSLICPGDACMYAVTPECCTISRHEKTSASAW